LTKLDSNHLQDNQQCYNNATTYIIASFMGTTVAGKKLMVIDERNDRKKKQ
jgi:hypothetical protein